MVLGQAPPTTRRINKMPFHIFGTSHLPEKVDLDHQASKWPVGLARDWAPNLILLATKENRHHHIYTVSFLYKTTPNSYPPLGWSMV